jgi:hypothetical protein
MKPIPLQEHPYPVELTILSFGIGNVEEVNELIKRYGLEEDLEHVIIPIHDKDGHTKRCYLLKRRFMRIVYPGEYYVDYPLAEVIEATVRYPDLLLSDALYLMHKESGTGYEGVPVDKEVREQSDRGEK